MTKNERRVLKQFFLVVSKTMPKHTEVDSVHIEDLKSSGGLKEKTLKARKKVADEFDAYALSSLDLSLEDLIYEAENGDVSKLQTTLMQFFGTMRVTSKKPDGSSVDVVPKRNTIDAIKSNLKVHILEKTKNKIDITSGGLFPEFSKFMKGFAREVKSLGRGDTKHHQPLDEESLKKIYSLGADVCAVLEARISDKTKLQDAVSRLPQQYHGSYHYLLQSMVQFVMTMFDVRRGKDGLDMLTKDHFQKCHYTQGGYDYYKKVLSEESKNHLRMTRKIQIFTKLEKNIERKNFLQFRRFRQIASSRS